MNACTQKNVTCSTKEDLSGIECAKHVAQDLLFCMQITLFNEFGEAMEVAIQIKRLIASQQVKYKDVAVLYRTKYQVGGAPPSSRAHSFLIFC